MEITTVDIVVYILLADKLKKKKNPKRVFLKELSR